MSAIGDVTARVPYGWDDRKPVLELDFPVAEYDRRLEGVQRGMAHLKLDALVVYGGAGAESNVRYLSGFPSWWGESLVVVPRNGHPTLITNAIFHGEPMHSNVQTSWCEDLRPLLNPQSTGKPKSVSDIAAEVVREHGVSTGRIGYADSKQLTARLDADLRNTLSSADFIDGSNVLRQVRRIKSAAEIGLLRRLGRATSAGMDAGLAAARPGVSENAVAAAVHAACIAEGCERMNFGVFALSGQRSYMKNIWPRPGKRIQHNELVVIDIGARMAGYQSDMSRNCVAGDASEELKRLLEACLQAEEAGLEHTRPGVTITSVLETMSGVIARHGYGEWDWTTGHGYGLDIVEEPMFYPGNRSLLEPGMCFYIEPMIVPTDVGTICIEDMVVVTEDGCEQLTTSSKRTW